MARFDKDTVTELHAALTRRGLIDTDKETMYWALNREELRPYVVMRINRAASKVPRASPKGFWMNSDSTSYLVSRDMYKQILALDPPLRWERKKKRLSAYLGVCVTHPDTIHSLMKGKPVDLAFNDHLRSLLDEADPPPEH